MNGKDCEEKDLVVNSMLNDVFLEYLAQGTKTARLSFQKPDKSMTEQDKVRKTLTHIICSSVVYRLPLNE